MNGTLCYLDNKYLAVISVIYKSYMVITHLSMYVTSSTVVVDRVQRGDHGDILDLEKKIVLFVSYLNLTLYKVWCTNLGKHL